LCNKLTQEKSSIASTAASLAQVLNYATPVRQVRVYNGGMCPLVTVYLFRDVHFAPTGNTVVCVGERDTVETVLGGGRLEALFKGKAVYTHGETK
jgi:hypothetical protein